MDHKFINEFGLVERYLMGRLAAEETSAFEEHFVDCPQCAGQLKTTRALMDGLRIVASAQAPAPRSYAPRGLSWPLRRTAASRRSLALAATVLLLVALVGTVVVANQIRRSRFETDRARSASAEWERRFEEERQSSSLVEMKHQDSDRDLTAKLAKLRAELENERKQNIRAMALNRGALKEPQINFPILALESTQRGEPALGAIKEITVSSSPANFAISAALEEERHHKTYRITIRDDHGRLIWRRSGSKPDRHDSLSFLFNSTLFRSGDYHLTVEGIAADGSTSIVDKYPFRVRKTP